MCTKMKFKVSLLFICKRNLFFARMIIASIARCFKNIFGVIVDYFSTMLPCAYKQHTTSPTNEFMFIYMHL